MNKEKIMDLNEPVLVTGSGGFIGSRLVKILADVGFTDIRCLVRNAVRPGKLQAVMDEAGNDTVTPVQGNLLYPEDCARAVEGVKVIYHLAAGRGSKSYADSYLNSVVTTRNLLDAAASGGTVIRFVNVSSFSVYSTDSLAWGGELNEECPVESRPQERGEAYCFAKIKQEEIAHEYSSEHGIPVVTIRPGVVYGPGNSGLTGRVGIDTFGFFMHVGGGNRIPLTYVDNCAEAIMLAGITAGVDGETFNVIDDDLPTSRRLLSLYKKNVGRFWSVYVPYPAFFALSWLWNWYASWSQGQMPPVFNPRRCRAYWKRVKYSNRKIKELLDWEQKVPGPEALQIYFADARGDAPLPDPPEVTGNTEGEVVKAGGADA
jgi:nucleoside-diphosphate-sugar epimerase